MRDRYRVVTPVSDRMTRYPRSLVWAEERANQLVRLVGSATIERRAPDGTWQTIARRGGGSREGRRDEQAKATG